MAYDRLFFSGNRNEAAGDPWSGLTGDIGFNVAQIPSMPSGGRRGAVGHIFRIKVASARSGIGCTAVTKFMDVKPVSARLKSAYIGDDLYPTRYQ